MVVRIPSHFSLFYHHADWCRSAASDSVSPSLLVILDWPVFWNAAS
jgi:hypothetical protein